MSTLNRNNFKISFLKERYEIAGKTVICRIMYKVNVPTGEYVRLNKTNGTFVALGKANCSPEDTFDVNIGKKIARTRAENKAYTTVMNYVIKVEDELKDILRTITPTEFVYDLDKDYYDKHPDDSFVDKAGNCIKHNLDYIKEQGEKAKPFVAPKKLKENNVSDRNKILFKNLNSENGNTAYKTNKDVYRKYYTNTPSVNKDKVLFEKHTPNCDIKITSSTLDSTELKEALDRLFGKFWLF